MTDPLDQIARICAEAPEDALSRIADVLGFKEQQAEPGADERAAFEAAYRNGCAEVTMRRNRDGRYEHDVQNTAWQIWQAARAAQQQAEPTNAELAQAFAYLDQQQAEPRAYERRLPGVHGVSRIADNPCALLLLLKGEPSDDALREIHDRLRAQPKIEGHHDETSSRAKDALRGIGACIADPMRANHAEVSKQTLKYWHKSLTDVLAAQSGQRAGVAEALDLIDRKALAGLCQMTHEGARAFLNEIREIAKGAAPTQQEGGEK